MVSLALMRTQTVPLTIWSYVEPNGCGMHRWLFIFYYTLTHG
jgi:hypothetical protein